MSRDDERFDALLTAVVGGAEKRRMLSAAVIPTWVDRVCAAIVVLENVPHPPSCGEWREDDCSCTLTPAKRLLWPLVGADVDMGRVPEGHPLQVARLAGSPAHNAQPESAS